MPLFSGANICSIFTRCSDTVGNFSIHHRGLRIIKVPCAVNLENIGSLGTEIFILYYPKSNTSDDISMKFDHPDQKNTSDIWNPIYPYSSISKNATDFRYLVERFRVGNLCWRVEIYAGALIRPFMKQVDNVQSRTTYIREKGYIVS